MARDKNRYLTGILGSVVLRRSRKSTIITSRVVPGTMKQSVETKKIAGEFGVASKLARYIRTMFKYDTGIYRDTEMHNRLTVEVHHSLLACKNEETAFYEFEEDTFDSLTTVEHLIKSQVRKRLYRLPTVIREGQIVTVRFKNDSRHSMLQFPGMSTSCKLTVSVGLFRLADGLMISTPMKKGLMLQKYKPLHADLDFVFKVPEGCLYVICLFLRYYRASVLLEGVKWHAGAICSAKITPGDFEDDHQHHWIKMPDLHFIPPS